MLEYTGAILTFLRDEIESLKNEDYFIVHVTNDQARSKIITSKSFLFIEPNPLVE